MYSKNDFRYYSNELYHHGIPKQKWGVKHGPPYPLDQEVHNRIVKGKAEYSKQNISDSKVKQERISKLVDELNNEWDYGVLDHGKKITDTSDYDWSKYKTIPVDTLKKEKIGVCWDFVNYQHDICKQLGLKDHSYMFVMQKSDDPDDVVTHTFTTYENDGKNYWIESAAWPKRGLHEIKDYKDAVTELNDMYKNDGSKAYSVFEYNADGMDKGLDDQEFFDKATQNLIYDSTPNNGKGKGRTTKGLSFDFSRNPGIKDALDLNGSYEGDASKYALKRLDKTSYKNLDEWGNSEDSNALYITGISGSGKSTIATFLAKEKNAEYINLDSYLSPMSEESKNQWQNKGLNKLLDKRDPDWRSVIKDDYSLDYKKVDTIANTIDEYGKQLYKSGKKTVVEGIQISDETLREDHSFYKDKPLMVVNTNAFVSNLRGSIRDSENPIEAIDLIATRFSYTKEAEKQLKKFKSEMNM